MDEGAIDFALLDYSFGDCLYRATFIRANDQAVSGKVDSFQKHFKRFAR